MDINSFFQLGSLTLPHRLIQGPLAGYSCAPFRAMYDLFQQPAYAVSEMLSAHDLLYRKQTRLIVRAPQEQRLCYQISGDDPDIMAQAAVYLESIGGDLIDINCGCPKAKIRKKGAGSALLSSPDLLLKIVSTVKSHLNIPLTVKIRIQGTDQDVNLVQAIADAGADAVIIHGRRWQDGYDIPADIEQIALIKQQVKIPVIANGDLSDKASLQRMLEKSACDAYMISRAGTGAPWLYQQLLETSPLDPSLLSFSARVDYFMLHLQGLAQLQNDMQAVLQSKSLVRHYFKPWFQADDLSTYYRLDSLLGIEHYLRQIIP